jgi:hypothetical protein
MLARRAALLALFSLPLGNRTALKASGGTLSIDLNQWDTIVVSHKGKSVTLTAADIFAALQERQ